MKVVGYTVVLLTFCLCSSQLGGIIFSQAKQTVKVSLYYECLCPFCIEFDSKQLYPGYQQLGDVLVVDLVPYGNAKRKKVNGSWEFICQHGDAECHGNKIQACVLANQTLPQSQRVGFVGCVMSSEDPSSDTNAQNCAFKNNLSWPEINQCVQNGKGDELLAHFGKITDALKPPLKYVPHIIFNDVFDKKLEKWARDDFIGAACSLFKVKPSSCMNEI